MTQKVLVPPVVVSSVIIYYYLILYGYIKQVYTPNKIDVRKYARFSNSSKQIYSNVTLLGTNENIGNIKENSPSNAKTDIIEVPSIPPNSSEIAWMKNMEEKYEKINERVSRVCRNYRTKSKGEFDVHNKFHQIVSVANGGKYKGKYFTNLLLDMKHQISFCGNAKVASSTWTRHFSKLVPSKERKKLFNKGGGLMSAISQKFKLPINQITRKEYKTNERTPFIKSLKLFLKKNNIFTFSFVRHPFERLVSAYKDKVLEDKMPLIDPNGHDYKTWYRKGHSFPAFVNLVLNEYRKDKECHKSYNRPCLGINMHWKSFNSRCLYCDIPYDMIGLDMNSFSDDVKFIILKQKLENAIPLESLSLQINKSGGNDHQKSDAKKETLTYFSKLTKWQIYQLYKMYRLDFEMFDYDTNIYFNVAKSN